jgi:16S rRNA (guanine527-N7)-methyltransferase
MNSPAPVPSDLAAAVNDLGLQLAPGQIEQLATYADRLATAAHNLTSTRDRDQVESRHVAESLAYGRLLATHNLLPDGARLLDLGAGGGLPGIPIRIAWPNIRLTLLESVSKKCRFMVDTSRELGLDGIEVLEGRAEDFARDPLHRGIYDLVVARAVAALPVLIEYALPFLRLGGHLAAVKGTSAISEIEASKSALQELGATLHNAPAFQPSQGPSQTVVLITKTAETPDRYPRRVGIPAKRPL